MTKATDTKLGTIMQGLVYPAVLGACLVFFVQNLVGQYQQAHAITPLFTTIENYYAVWLLLYFSVPFLILSYTSHGQAYNVVSFMTDIGDVTIIFAAFYWLGLIEPAQNVNMACVLWAITAIPVLAAIHNYSLGRKIQRMTSLFALAITIPMAIWGSENILFLYFAVILLTVILGIYLKNLDA